MRRWLDVTIAAGLLLMVLWPVRSSLTLEPPPAFGPLARTRLAWEGLNRGALARGNAPLWNPYQFGGRPHLADPETLALYPPHLALRFLPLHLLFPVSFVLHGWAAGIGAYLTARWLGAGRAVAGAGAAAVLLAGVLAPRPELAYSSETFRLGWLPLVAAFTIKSLKSPARLPHPLLLVVATFAVMASGRGLFYTALTLAACYAWALWFGLLPAARAVVARQAAWVVVFVCGLAAYQLLPALRLRFDGGRAGGWTYDRITETSRHTTRVAPLEPEAAITKALDRAEGRVLSTCDRLLDGSQTIAARLRGVDGYGGLVSGDFARVINLARGADQAVSSRYAGLPEAGGEPARLDLLRLLQAEYLVACDAPDASWWTLEAQVPGGGVYRSVAPAPRAVWTCLPQAAGPKEIEARLHLSRYDGSLTLPFESPIVHVRWAPAVDDMARERAEAELALTSPRRLDDRTWQYRLPNTSVAHVKAIVADPRVDDTGHIDRRTGVVDSAPQSWDEPKDQWLAGGEPCDDTRPVAVAGDDGVDGRLLAGLDAPRAGVVLFSEVFHADRRAWLDGQAVTPLKVDLAFLGVPVPAGIHRIELRYDARPFRLGAAVSILTLAGWLVMAWGRRTHSPGGTVA